MKTLHKGEYLWESRLDRFAEDIIEPTGVSERVIEAFRKVDRAMFAPGEHWNFSLTDRIIPLKDGSTISQPTLVANMLNLLDLKGDEKVLELGTATGYQAALLSHLAGEVHTVELDYSLSQEARRNLAVAGCENVTVVQGDGALGLPKSGPFNRIIVTAALSDVPPALKQQLDVGGKLLAPVGDYFKESRLTLYEKISLTEVVSTDHGAVQFVPLMSTEEGGWTKQRMEQSELDMLEKRRKPVRDWLIERWQSLDLVYEEYLADLADIMAADLGLEEPLTEGQVLDIIGLVYQATALPPEETQTEAAAEAEAVA
ncbi:MAG: protein-L-isoaspartate O-methyltransferase [Candidatus Saccharimonadales bacterium]